MGTLKGGKILSTGGNIGERYVKALWFEQINSGTSGTLTAPTQGEIVLNQWSAGVDALASTIASGIPAFVSPVTAGGVIITATLDSSGNWSLSGTPSAYPVAIVYAYQVKLRFFDYTKQLGGYELIPAAGGVFTDVANFGGKLSSADTTVQKALDTLDDHAHHDAVTLAVSADILLGLSGQILSLDTQAANLGFFGPASGADAAPTFRALVAADLGTGLTPTFAGITIADGGTIGLGTGKGLIQFDDELTDTIIFMNCFVGIGKSTPVNALEILGQLAIDTNINVGGFTIFGSVDNVSLSVTALGTGQNGVKLVSTAGGSGFGQGKFLVCRGSDYSPLITCDVTNLKIGIGDNDPGEILDVAGNINATGIFKIDDVQVVGNRIIDATVDDSIEAGFTALYPLASGILNGLRTAMQTHGLIAAA